MAEWSNAAVLKTVDLNGSGGSNPSLSAKKWLTDICRPLFVYGPRALLLEKCAWYPQKRGYRERFSSKTARGTVYKMYVLESDSDFLTVVVYGLSLSHEVYSELPVLLHA